MNLDRRAAHPFLIFAVVAPALLMASIDGTIVSVGLPTITRELHTSPAWAAWTMTCYMLAQLITMPIAGKLSDEWGRKSLFIGAISLFTLASVAASLAPNIEGLVFFRRLEGIGGGVFPPTPTGIIADAF